MTPEERKLFRDAGKRAASRKAAAVVCRHGWPMPTHLVSRRIVRDGVEFWTQVSVVTQDGGCPDD